MSKLNLIWTLVAGAVVGVAALATGYVYSDRAQDVPDAPATVSGSPEAGTDAAAPAPNPEAAAPAAEDSAAGAETLTFDVVGVEPTGDTVVAGQSEAGAIVALTANGKVVGKTIANEKGEWTIILEQPLAPGDYDVGLTIEDEAGVTARESSQRLAVSIPEGGKDRPLVVLNSPDAPSDILQMPTPTQLAVKENSADTAAAETAADASGSPVETVVAAAETPQSAPQTGKKPAGEIAAAPEPTVAAAPAASGGSETGAAETPGAMDEAPAGAVTAEAPSSGAAEMSQSGEPVVSQTPAPGVETPGAGSTGAPLAAADETAPTDAGAPTSAAAPASADVPAAPEQGPVEVATAEQPKTEQPETAQETATEAADAVSESDLKVTVDAVESEDGKVFVAGTGEPGSSVRVYVGDEYAGKADVAEDGRWLVEGQKQIAAGDVEVRADLVGTTQDKVEARAAVTFEKEADKQIILTRVAASGEASGGELATGAVAKPLPVVIIRKGDNLWRISRRLYGEGVRYTTIYQANQQQIRDPDLIYPGQVFLTPEGDLNWPRANN